jgi:hypothetical protein
MLCILRGRLEGHDANGIELRISATHASIALFETQPLRCSALRGVMGKVLHRRVSHGSLSTLQDAQILHSQVFLAVLLIASMHQT